MRELARLHLPVAAVLMLVPLHVAVKLLAVPAVLHIAAGAAAAQALDSSDFTNEPPYEDDEPDENDAMEQGPIGFGASDNDVDDVDREDNDKTDAPAGFGGLDAVGSGEGESEGGRDEGDREAENYDTDGDGLPDDDDPKRGT